MMKLKRVVHLRAAWNRATLCDRNGRRWLDTKNPDEVTCKFCLSDMAEPTTLDME